MLYFHNPGEIDIRGATIAGLSAKQGDNPIGFFGTGLKYSIASVLRWGGRITIWAGETEYEFSAEAIDFRGQSFDQIRMSTVRREGTKVSRAGSTLGFTTEYGKQWKPWQVFRELYANALDEGGTVSLSQPASGPGYTTIAVDCKELEQEFANQDKIILPPDSLYHVETTGIKIIDTPADAVYYRGIRVADFSTSVIYNIQTQLALTEDRTVKSEWDLRWEIQRAVQRLSDPSLIEKILTQPKETFEGRLRFYRDNPSQTFLETAKRLFRLDPKGHGNLQDFVPAEMLQPVPIDLSSVRQAMLNRAIALVKGMGHRPDDFSIKVADLGASRLGSYSNGQIYLDPKVFEQGTKQVLSTLLEELVHAETGHGDCNYPMQTYLFNRIVSLYEDHVFQEPI